MTSAIEHRHNRSKRVARLVLMGVLCMVVGQTLWAQPSYQYGSSTYSHSSYYPEPPRGFRGGQPYECDLYARDNAEWYVPRGSGVASGAVRGAVGGAVFGAIVGGSKGARRGALAGGGLGAVAAGAKARQDREFAYRLAYDDCMQRFRR